MGCLFFYLVHTVMNYLRFVYHTCELMKDMETKLGCKCKRDVFEENSVPGSVVRQFYDAKQLDESGLKLEMVDTQDQRPNYTETHFNQENYTHQNSEMQNITNTLNENHQNNPYITHKHIFDFNIHIPSPPSQLPPKSYC